MSWPCRRLTWPWTIYAWRMQLLAVLGGGFIMGGMCPLLLVVGADLVVLVFWQPPVLHCSLCSPWGLLGAGSMLPAVCTQCGWLRGLVCLMVCCLYQCMPRYKDIHLWWSELSLMLLFGS